MQRPTALFFDLDGTLVDDDASVLRSCGLVCELLRSSLPRLDDSLLTETYVRVSQALWDTGKVLLANQHELRLQLWRETLALAGCYDEALAVQARGAYAAFRLEKPVLYDDALPALDALRGRYRLAVITNGLRDVQRHKFTETGLDRYFDLIVTSDDFGAGKPDPAIFRHALGALSLDPGRTWHIGDSLVADVAGARAAALAAGVWLNRLGLTWDVSHPEPPAEIATLAELPALLA